MTTTLPGHCFSFSLCITPQAVQIRHDEIQKDQIDLLFFQNFQGFKAIERHCCHSKRGISPQGFQQFCGRALVVVYN